MDIEHVKRERERERERENIHPAHTYLCVPFPFASSDCVHEVDIALGCVHFPLLVIDIVLVLSCL